MNRKMYVLDKSRFFQLRLILSLAILSIAIISYEIQLIQFFTIIQWHDFAYMIISIALLGFGASGVVISIFRKRLLKRKEILIPFFMIFSGLLMTIVVRISRSDFFLFDSYTLLIDHIQFSRLLFGYILFFLPFFSGAMAIGLIFVNKVSEIGTYYFSDLLGAGIGGVLVIFLFWRFTPQEIPSIIAILPILAGLLILDKKYRLLLILFAILSFSLIGFHLSKPFDLSYSQFKGLSYALNLPEAKIENKINSPYGLMQVVSSPVLRYAPGLSLTYINEIPAAPMIFNNGNWYASIPKWTIKDTIHFLNYTTMALPYALMQPKSVLLLQSGAGLEISHALTNHVKKITAIESNAMVISLLENEYADQTDSLFYHPFVHIENMESRSFLSQTKDKYDLIQLPLYGSFGGTLGLNALQEEKLLTIEAFKEMWLKLNPNGSIVLSSWIDVPPNISLKTEAMISKGLEYFEINNPLDHIVAIRSWGTLTIVVKHSTLSLADIENIRSFCLEKNFDIILLPGLKEDEKSLFNTMEDENFFNDQEAMFGADRDRIIQSSNFNIQSATDDKPYFYHFLPWKNIIEMIKNKKKDPYSFMELGYLIVLVTFIQVIILAMVFILLPLFSLGWKGGNEPWILLYFCSLGVGYMFLEIVFIKYFVLYLGQPIYSVATVISVMLISSGIGSYYSSRYKTDKRTLKQITGIITGLILVYAFFMGSILTNTVGLSATIKYGIACILIAIPSFFMGMPFPIGLKIVDTIKKSHVAWAWGINGCLSVISTSLAILLAVEMGFMAVMLFSALAYGIAYLSNFLKLKIN